MTDQTKTGPVNPHTIDIVTAVWGASFTEFFVRVCLRSLLAPGNLPNLVSRFDCRYQIHVDSESAEIIRNSDVYTQLSNDIAVEIYEHQIKPGNIYDAVTELHEASVQYAYERDAAIMFITPDFVLSNNSFQSLGDMIDAGKRLVFVAPPRLVKEEVWDRLHAGDATPIDLPPRALVSLGCETLHEMTELCIWESDRFGSWPHHIFFEAPGEGFVARGFHMHPLYVAPVRRSSLDGSTFDTTFVSSASVPLRSVQVVDDSDDVMVFECSARDKIYATPVPNSQRFRFASQFVEIAAMRRHLEIAQHPIYIHHEERGESSVRAERKSRILVKLMRRRAKLTSYSLFFLDPMVAFIRAKRYAQKIPNDIRTRGPLERLFLRRIHLLGNFIEYVYRNFEHQGVLPDDWTLFGAVAGQHKIGTQVVRTLPWLVWALPWVALDILRFRWFGIRDKTAWRRLGMRRPFIREQDLSITPPPSVVKPHANDAPAAPPEPDEYANAQAPAPEDEAHRLRQELRAAEDTIQRMRFEIDTALDLQQAAPDTIPAPPPQTHVSANAKMESALVADIRRASVDAQRQGSLDQAIRYLDLIIDHPAPVPDAARAADIFNRDLLRLIERSIARDFPFDSETAASKPDARCLFSTVLWGREYARQFVDVLIPSLLAEGNLPYLAKTQQSVYQIVTTPTAKALITGAPSFQQLAKFCDIQFILVPDTLTDQITLEFTDPRRWHVSGALHHISVVHAQRARASLCLLPPDIVLSNGLFRLAHQQQKKGFKSIVCTGPLIDGASFENCLDTYRQSDGSICLSGRELSSEAVPLFHPVTLRTFPTPGNDRFLPGRVNLLWDVPEGVRSHAAHQHPLFIAGEAWPDSMEYSYQTVDTDLLERIFRGKNPDDEIYVVSNFDEFSFFNLASGPAPDVDVFQYFDLDTYVESFWGTCSALNYWLFHQPTLIRSDSNLNFDPQTHETVDTQVSDIDVALMKKREERLGKPQQ